MMDDQKLQLTHATKYKFAVCVCVCALYSEVCVMWRVGERIVMDGLILWVDIFWVPNLTE